MSLGCLSDVFRMPPKCPLSRSTSSRTVSLRQTKPVMSLSTCEASRSQKGSVFLMLSRRKPLGIGSDLIEKWVKILYTKICDSSLHPVALRSCIPVTLHLCDLTPYTLHLTFSFFHFAILAFRSRQNAKWQEQAGTRCLPTPATFYAFLSFFYYAWRYQS